MHHDRQMSVNQRLRLFIVTIAMGALVGVVAPPAVAATTAQQITSIRTEVAAINKRLPKMAAQTKNVEGITVEGTEATYYSSGKDLRKIRATLYGETFRATVELYFRRGALIFAFERYERYEAELGSPVESTTEYRFYFSGSRTLRLLIDAKQVSPSNEDGAKLVSDIRLLTKLLVSAR